MKVLFQLKSLFLPHLRKRTTIHVHRFASTWIRSAPARSSVLSDFRCSICPIIFSRFQTRGFSRARLNAQEHPKYISKVALEELLQNEVGLDKEQTKILDERHPYISTLTKADMTQKIQFFKEKLNPSPTEFRRLFSEGMAHVLHLEGFESVVSRAQYLIEFLEEIQPGEQSAARTLILGFPTILKQSRKNHLIPKFSFFVDEVCQGNKAAFAALLLESPDILIDLSLPKQIRPRVLAIRDVGLDPAKHIHTLRYPQPKFNAWLRESGK